MKVFISHTSKDHDFVLHLAEKIKKDNIDVWLDDWELEVGDSIVEKIQEGLEKSSFLIVILSEYSKDSNWVMKELNLTLMRQLGKDHVVILPVLLELDFEEVPPLLRDIYSVKFERNLIVDSQYKKLIEPIRKKAKAEEISKYQDKYFENIVHVDLILKKKVPSRHEVNFVLGLIKDAHYKNYFFKQVDALHWFNVLKAEGYFEAINAPGPKPADQDGLYSIPWWNVLSYLEKLSEQVTEPGNENYSGDLLKIIKDVSIYKANGQHTDNFYTWRSFVTILLNIPRENIPIDIIELIPIWLHSKYDASHVGSEIGIKLLPKFLSGDPTYDDSSKAEGIVSYIADIKSVPLDPDRAKLYRKDKEYKLLIEPYWLIKIIEKNHAAIADKCTNNVIIALSQTINKLLHQDESRIPFEANQIAHLFTLSFEESQYSLRVFDMGKTDDINVLDCIMMNKEIDKPQMTECQIDECPLERFVDQAFEKLSALAEFNKLNADVLKKEIYNLYRNYHDKGTYQSFYDNKRDHLSDPLEVLTFGLKSILNVRAKKHLDDTREILRSFFQKNYMFYPKMALYVIGNNIEKYGDIFWEALESDHNYFFYESSYFGDELKHVLEGLQPISPEHKEMLKKIIAAGPKKIREKNGEYINLWKQERYHALIKDTEFQELYDTCKEETKIDAALHAGVGEIKTRWGEGPSPLTKDDVLRKLTNKSLPAFLAEFKSKGFWEDAPTVGGLAKLLKESAAKQPTPFIDNLPSFSDTGFIYIYEILDGVREACSKKLDIAWNQLLEFIYTYINRNDFWEDKFIVEKKDFLGGATHLWIIGGVTGLLREGTKSDSFAYGEDNIQQVENIIFLILDKLTLEEEKDSTDYVTDSLNSSYGKTIIALIHHALLVGQLKGTEDGMKWSEGIKGKYDELYEKQIIESYTLLGRYFPSLYYLDKDWAVNKAKGLYPKEYSRQWEAFIDGYLSIGTVYHELYELMVPHYEFGISHDFKGKRDNEHLIQHIALGYLLSFDPRGLEEPDTLIRKILDTWNIEQVLDIISFLCSNQRLIEDEKEESKKAIEKIIAIWKWIYENRYNNKPETKLTDGDKKIQSALSRLTAFLPSITEEYAEWVLYAAPYAEENYNASLFIEYLDKYDGLDNMKYIGQIYLEMLTHSTPTFDKEHIRSIVEKLYKHDCKETADDICNKYGMRGEDFLKDLYDQYNN